MGYTGMMVSEKFKKLKDESERKNWELKLEKLKIYNKLSISMEVHMKKDLKLF